jgi:hypothetical protein
VPGVGGQEARFGAEFASFFSCVDGATPEELLHRNIYGEIAIALKGGPWREASMAVLGLAFGLSKEQAGALADGEDALGIVMDFAAMQMQQGVSTVSSGASRLMDRSVSKAVAKAAAEARKLSDTFTDTMSAAFVDVEIDVEMREETDRGAEGASQVAPEHTREFV